MSVSARWLDKQTKAATPIATTPITQDFPALPQAFFARPAQAVAPALIGCLLVKGQTDGSLLWGVIVETEAYSQDDPVTSAYRHHAKGGSKCHWGSRMLKRLVEARGAHRSKRRRVSPGQQQLPFAFDCRLNQIPDEWHQIAVKFRSANGIRDGDGERSCW